ncbi:hypothetical protein [Natronobacterium gregoryi]|uniref:Uncharacterized protein n=2 Tax=Natronobacterium gregoryi TaxID=44930 RepID=L0ALB4_NATGS|nr:hypothetical protein [Natronobacterium gregoryi]AFZ73982.1 hypothetical protein Natgr_2838 [Natronobacterium gregoryi SP2]ELY68824.1 hypothetical protein C490_08931 [Natronobacterium gregoryi SP2]PLK18290.1 hypothetical protein CYV19_18360 [Natronobacterium gregoryi SP2]SFJ72386.1 hypothetical protein SAMN05443661_1663 [Natronobacterium gregoryi]
MFTILTPLLTLLGAYAVYADAVARDTDSPIGWALCTAAVGFLLGPLFLGGFLVVYLFLHALERWWGARKTGA